MSVKHLSTRGNEGDIAHKGSASVDSENKVQGIMKHIRRGGKVPPPIVDHEGTVIDGHHRVEASKRLGHKHMKVRQLPKALVKTSMATESVAHLMEDDYD
jgi:ParB-like chromosome segregation protein Spo0J